LLSIIIRIYLSEFAELGCYNIVDKLESHHKQRKGQRPEQKLREHCTSNYLHWEELLRGRRKLVVRGVGVETDSSVRKAPEHLKRDFHKLLGRFQ
jgi:hypothetical protein